MESRWGTRQRDMVIGEIDMDGLELGTVEYIPTSFGTLLKQASVVCLETQNHAPGVTLAVRGEHNANYALVWDQIPDQVRPFWPVGNRTTEYGAIGVAVLIAKRATGYSVIETSRHGTGFDYWLGDEAENTLQRKARLEVSGILNGNLSTIRSRVRQKTRQTDRSDETMLPAYVIVVEFSQPSAEVQLK